mgnify:CR=1 FL=1
MSRILLQLEYDGTAYAGWQRQSNALAVQQVLEEALSQACGHPVTATGSSRTDAGVHALSQMVHFDTSASIPPDKYPFVLNHLLPPDIRVKSGRPVPPDFHARFLASGKMYYYRVLLSRHGSALRRNACWHIPVPLSAAPMLQAVARLPGTHDFAAFQAAGGTAKTTVRTLHSATLSFPEDEMVLRVSGNAFLYNMVRIIVGTLVEIGLEKRSPDAFDRAFASGNRLDLGMTAPPHGLVLAEVRYPPAAFTDPESVRWAEPEQRKPSETGEV